MSTFFPYFRPHSPLFPPYSKTTLCKIPANHPQNQSSKNSTSPFSYSKQTFSHKKSAVTLKVTTLSHPSILYFLSSNAVGAPETASRPCVRCGASVPRRTYSIGSAGTNTLLFSCSFGFSALSVASLQKYSCEFTSTFPRLSGFTYVPSACKILAFTLSFS